MVIVILTGWGVAGGCVLFARLLMFVSFWMFTLVFGFGGSLVFGVDLLLLVGGCFIRLGLGGLVAVWVYLDVFVCVVEVVSLCLWVLILFCCLLIVLFYWLLILIVLLWLYKFNFDLFSYGCLCIVYVLCCCLLRLFVYGNLWWLCSCAMVLVGCLWCLGWIGAVVLICVLVGYAGLFLVDLRFALVIMVLVVWVFYLDELVD